jgi:hypothetical protein
MVKKAIAKYIKRMVTNPVKLKKKPKTKPKPRYRTEPKTGEKFLNRRATVSGVKPSKGEAIPEFIKKRPITTAGIVVGAAGAAQYRRKKLYEERDKQKKQLKEATDKIRDKDKKKKEKRKDNYGGK